MLSVTFFIVLLNVILMSVVMLSVVILNVVAAIIELVQICFVTT